MRRGSLFLVSVSIKNSQRLRFLLQQDLRQEPLGTPRSVAPCMRLVHPHPVGLVQTSLFSGHAVFVLEKRVVVWGAAVTLEASGPGPQRVHCGMQESIQIPALRSRPFLSARAYEASRL